MREIAGGIKLTGDTLRVEHMGVSRLTPEFRHEEVSRQDYWLFK